MCLEKKQFNREITKIRVLFVDALLNKVVHYLNIKKNYFVGRQKRSYNFNAMLKR